MEGVTTLNEFSLDREYKVLVLVLTYNHKLYIEDALKSVLMQQTNFPFASVVFDDCSTDGTTEIVRRYESQYPDLIKGWYMKENMMSQGASPLSLLLPYAKYGKYIAICEGDDYWTDPFKLQKQVDFMEIREDCKMSFHSVVEHWQDNSAPDKVFFPVEDRVYMGAEIFKQWVVSTCSVMIRSDVFKNVQLLEMFKNKGLMFYDQALFMSCDVEGNVMGMSDVMGVYRRVNNGYTLQLDSNLKQSYQMIDCYCTHLQEMEKIFGDQLGEEFLTETKNRIVSNSLDGCYLAMKNKDMKQGQRFFAIAFQRSAIDTIISLPKKLVKKIIS